MLPYLHDEKITIRHYFSSAYALNQNSSMRLPVTVLLALLCSTASIAQSTWYVNAKAPASTADGTSWSTAIPYLQDALEAALPGDIIWIAAGVYKPTTNNDRTASFRLKDGIKLYGGFAGTETQLQQRDWQANPTILSGDIGTPGVADDNAYSILYATKTGFDTRLDGLVFEDGNANHPDNVNILFYEKGHSGSAVFLDGLGAGNFAYLTIANSTFRRNWSDYYGAVYANGRNGGKSAVQIENCTFIQNRCGGGGGAVAVDNDDTQAYNIQIKLCTFEENYAHNRGGALLLGHHADVFVQDCTFKRDSVRFHAGGAVSIEGDNVTSNCRFDNCLFEQNRVGSGAVGGAIVIEQIYANLKLTFQNCRFLRHKAPDLIWAPTLFSAAQIVYQNCIFQENNVANLVFNQTIGVTGEQRFVNCLFYKNAGAEIYDYFDANDQTVHRFQNCIIVKDPGLDIVNGGPKVEMDHCMVSQPDCAALGLGVSCGPGMIFSADPLFFNPSGGDFHLMPCSPAIDAGNNDATAMPATDLAGEPRIQNKAADIGPYEHAMVQGTIKPASCPDSRDGAIEFGGYFCPPLLLSWTKDEETGARTDSLAAGTYIFTFQDAGGNTETDTLFVPTLPPLAILPNVAGVSCFGLSDGVAGIDLSGGTPPHSIKWENGSTAAFLFGVAPGNYPVSVTDANGCVATDVITVSDPGLMQVLYTVTPASGPGKADGSIRIDSIVNGTGPYSWNNINLENLLPGTYVITVTDANGCVVVAPVVVGIATAAGEPDAMAFRPRIAPNPVTAGDWSLLQWGTNDVQAVLIHDSAGRLIRQVRVSPGETQIMLQAPAVAGVYRVTALKADGKVQICKWNVF